MLEQLLLELLTLEVLVLELLLLKSLMLELVLLDLLPLEMLLLEVLFLELLLLELKLLVCAVGGAAVVFDIRFFFVLRSLVLWSLFFSISLSIGIQTLCFTCFPSSLPFPPSLGPLLFFWISIASQTSLLNL